MPLPGSRRLVRALLLACVTAILLGAAVGASDGAQAQSRPAVAVPTPRIGDRGAYTATLDGSYGSGPDGSMAPFPFLAFDWQPGAPVRGGDGLVHATERIQTSGWAYNPWATLSLAAATAYGTPLWERHNDTLLAEQGASSVVAVDGALDRVTYSNATGNLGLGPLNPGSLDEQREVTTGTERSFDPSAGASCLFLNALQNRTIAVGDEVDLDGCSLHGLVLFQGGAYRAAAMESVQGLPALRLDPVEGGPGAPNWTEYGYHFGAHITFWVASGIPYPVRMAWTSDHQAARSILELTGFQAGAQERAAPAAPRDPAPALAFVAPKPWGLDETGIHHPFPLSAAFRGARDDTRFTALRAYLSAHPDAYLGRADYSVGADSRTGTLLTWQFTVTDGDTWLDVRAQRSDAPSRPLAPAAPLAVPGGEGTNTTYSASQGQATQYYFGTYPPPPQAPDRLPAVASLMARWNAYAAPADQALAANAWGFEIDCLRILEKDCRYAATVTAWAGHRDATAGAMQLDQSTTPPTLRSTSTLHSSVLTTGGNATLGLEESSRVDDSSSGIPPAPPLGAGGSGPASEARAGVPLAAWVPNPSQAAGVGAAAVAVGLLYYLWPLARGGLGLFSRLKQPEVLAHPARQQLLQLIEAEPGIHFKEMARRTGLPNGSLVHHLETLRRGGQVVARPAGGYTLYFLGAHVPAGSAEAASALKADGARRILGLVRQQPGLSGADVAARCGLQPSTVTYHVQRLQAAGLLTGLRDGRAVRLHPVAAAE